MSETLSTLVASYIVMGCLFAWSYANWLRKKGYPVDKTFVWGVTKIFLTWPSDLYAMLETRSTK